MLCILYENINESSFIIRKRIISTLADLISSDYILDIDISVTITNEIEHFNNVNIIFLNKLTDNSESMKIKNIIIDYYYNIFAKSKVNCLLINTLKIFVKIMNDNIDQFYNSYYYDNLKCLFTVNIYNLV